MKNISSKLKSALTGIGLGVMSVLNPVQTANANLEYKETGKCSVKFVEYSNPVNPEASFFLVDENGDNLPDKINYFNSSRLKRSVIKFSEPDLNLKVYNQIYQEGIKRCLD
ncbi:hypothetical protein HY448_02585 [Candidatus Pacearchaeota archaeon]|nr:hypothetical protein [Candidatus Pacearchaeota archaeon]